MAAKNPFAGNIAVFDEACRKLSRQVSPAVHYLTYLEYLSDNEFVWNKYRDSFCGNVIKMNIITAENALILFCSRLFDSTSDAVSLKNAVHFVQCNQITLDERRSRDKDAIVFGDDWGATKAFRLKHESPKPCRSCVPLGLLAIRRLKLKAECYNESRKQDLIRHFEKLDRSKTLKILKVLRHENLAHLIFESRERKKSRGIDFDDHGLTKSLPRNELSDINGL